MRLHKEFSLNVKFIDLQCQYVFPYQSISETILNEQNSIEACEKLESTTDFMSLPISIPSLAATCYRFLKNKKSAK